MATILRFQDHSKIPGIDIELTQFGFSGNDNEQLGRDFRNLFMSRLAKFVEQETVKVEEAGLIADLMARSKRKGQGQVEVSLSKVEFVQQCCLHILPKDFTKTRRIGAWSGTKRRIYMERCTALAPKSLEATAKPVTTNSIERKHRSCPHCRVEMACIVKEERQRWRELFYGPDHPAWLEWTSRGLDSPHSSTHNLPLRSALLQLG